MKYLIVDGQRCLINKIIDGVYGFSSVYVRVDGFDFARCHQVPTAFINDPNLSKVTLRTNGKTYQKEA